MIMNQVLVVVVVAVLAVTPVLGECPFGHTAGSREEHVRVNVAAAMNSPPVTHVEEVVDYEAVAADIKLLLTDSQDFWPADFGNYGPFFIRLAWHCTGSYRLSDGRGGCDGGNIRFEPVRSWDDNTNLDKALLLLEPIKDKYGPALSWGDLIVLAGTTAIESMGGPVLGFCGGRIDDADGVNHLELGPTRAQEEVAPCPEQGACQWPLGTSTVGLIYVNPEGYMANWDPTQSVPQIREVFGRMSMNDTETVALIGGGHAFGRTHGACPAGPGPAPKDNPYNPWPGLCEEGTYTSGLDGPWTGRPTQWSNDYFNQLLDLEYELVDAPSGHKQYEPVAGQNAPPGIMMLTTDIALTYDDKYKALVEEFAHDITSLEEQFAAAWYKLTSRDMGPVERCVGNLVAPPQPFQYPVEPTTPNATLYAEATALIEQALYQGGSFSDPVDGQNYQGALFVQLAYQCASTFRSTDYRGGCNGAAIRFPPQSEWPVNKNMNLVLEQLGLIKDQLSSDISWADLIVLAGTVALNEAGGLDIPFCGGRGDYQDGSSSENLEPRNYVMDPIINARDNMKVMGLTPEEYAALAGRPRSPAYMTGLGYTGSWTSNPSVFNNTYFQTVLQGDFQFDGIDPSGSGSSALPNMPSIFQEYKADQAFITGFDLPIKYSPILKSISLQYASDERLFKDAFTNAWTKLMNADRFDGPTGNLCH